MEISEYDEALARYQSENPLPENTQLALGQLRALLHDRKKQLSETAKRISCVRFEEGGNAGIVAVIFQTNLIPPSIWKYELCQALKDELDIAFQRVGDYQTANWKEGIEIAIS